MAVLYRICIRMFYISNCELQNSKIRIVITCIHSKIYEHKYRYVSTAHICALGSQRVKLSDQIGRLISKISKLFTLRKGEDEMCSSR